MIEQAFHIDTAIQQLITAEQAHHYRIIPVQQQSDQIEFLTDAIDQDQLRIELEIILGQKVALQIEDTHAIDKRLQMNYRRQQSTSSQSLHFNKDFLNTVIQEAKQLGSSDIHFEAFELTCRVRFRIDGKLIERYIIERHEYPSIVNRIKILAQLDISEKRLPQDGRINLSDGTTDFDIRVSSLPTLHGEKIVLRLLSKDSTNIQLNSLGFSEKELTTYSNGIKHPNGIILISGPTGSGKTTTLYATLKELNKDDTNVLTIEDPIEYTLEGINQVQLKNAIGLDFATALKTFLRQDPDIIMVGEIRDVATANMAVRASLTGHLVLSTIHTNSAWGTISRLVDMGVPSFLIAATIKLSVAQRLVRKLCERCKSKEPINSELFPQHYRIPSDLQFHYNAIGCEACHFTGYHGRQAIYEIIPITKELIQSIRDNELEIDNYLETQQIHTLGANALRLIKNGTTSIEEVYTLLTE